MGAHECGKGGGPWDPRVVVRTARGATVLLRVFSREIRFRESNADRVGAEAEPRDGIPAPAAAPERGDVAPEVGIENDERSPVGERTRNAARQDFAQKGVEGRVVLLLVRVVPERRIVRDGGSPGRDEPRVRGAPPDVGRDTFVRRAADRAEAEAFRREPPQVVRPRSRGRRHPRLRQHQTERAVGPTAEAEEAQGRAGAEEVVVQQMEPVGMVLYQHGYQGYPQDIETMAAHPSEEDIPELR